MTTDLACRLGNTLISAVTQPASAVSASHRATTPSVWRTRTAAVFSAPARFVAHLQRRQAERDALIRYAMNEGKELGLGRNDIERAVILTGRADLLFPSYYANAHRR